MKKVWVKTLHLLIHSCAPATAQQSPVSVSQSLTGVGKKKSDTSSRYPSIVREKRASQRQTQRQGCAVTRDAYDDDVRLAGTPHLRRFIRRLQARRPRR